MGEYIHKELDLSTIKPIHSPSDKPECPRTMTLIRALSLSEHMEGGYFAQTDSAPTTMASPYPKDVLSSETVALAGPTRPGFDASVRRLSTTIFYLLSARRPQGMFHRNRSRVIHTLHRGRGRYVLIHLDGRVETFIVGQSVELGERLQWVVEGNVWKASYLLSTKGPMEDADPNDCLLISETVMPGFEYCDHQFLSGDGLRNLLPENQARELNWLVRQQHDDPENSLEGLNETDQAPNPEKTANGTIAQQPGSDGQNES